MPDKADDWGVWVNECGIFASGHGEGKWLYFLGRARESRMTMLGMTPGGGEWHVMCGTKEAATEGRDIFMEQGIHRTHVKVMRLCVCLAKAARRRDLAEAAIRAAAGGGGPALVQGGLV